MLDAYVIREPDSSYPSVVLVRKPSGVLRFCIDWQKLNNMIRKDAYMLSCFDDTIDVVSSATFFS